MSKVEEAKAEVDAALAELQPRLLGLREFKHMLVDADDTEEARNDMDDAINTYSRREAKLLNAQKALDELTQDGHPAAILITVPQAIFDIYQRNLGSVQAAFSQFRPLGEAVSGEVVFEN